MEGQLLVAIGAMFSSLTGLAGAAFFYLRGQITIERENGAKREAAALDREKAAKTECDGRVTKLETKLDEATAIITRQAEAQQAQIVSQQAMIGTLQELLAKESA